jgi:type III restriction enzyme
MNVVLNNYKIFSQLIDEAVKNYKPIKDIEVKTKMEEVEEWNKNWEISKTRNFNPYTYTKGNYSKYIYNPCYLNLDNNLEKDFVNFIEKNNQNIAWWWQN